MTINAWATAPNCGQMIDEVSAQLHGWGSTQDRITPLAVGIGPSDTTLTVDFAFGQSVGITPGVIEIDSELLYVTAVDATTGICTLAHGFGRGYSNTTAASHSAGAKVISRPRFPRIWLLKQLNNLISSVYPDLFVPATYQTVVTYPNNTYALPSPLPVDILGAQWQDPYGRWIDCRSYKIDPYDGAFRLGDSVPVGFPLRILYAQEPGPFQAESDSFTVTGLPNSCYEVLTLGVVAKQVPGLDISRAQVSSVEQSDRSRVVPPMAGIQTAKYLMAEYQDRLHNEARSLRAQYKARITRKF